MGSIREHTCLIVRKDRRYLVGVSIMGRLNWSAYRYDAWRTWSGQSAEMVARRVGGDLMLFNPITGDVAEYGGRCGYGRSGHGGGTVLQDVRAL